MGLKITKLKHKEDVYDFTVLDTHNFYANDILVHNCEIDLPTKSINNILVGTPVKKNIKMTKADYEKYLIWRKNNPKTPLPNS